MSVPTKPRAGRVKPSASSAALDFGVLEDFLGFHLRVAQEASFRAFARRVDVLAVKPQRYAILQLINNNPGVTQSLLSKASGRDKSTLTSALGDLHRHGFIDRRPVPRDQRSSTLHITEAGRLLLADLVIHAREHEIDLNRIVGKDRKKLIMLLRRITQELTSQLDRSSDAGVELPTSED